MACFQGNTRQQTVQPDTQQVAQVVNPPVVQQPVPQRNPVETIVSPVGMVINGIIRGLSPGAASAVDLKYKTQSIANEDAQVKSIISTARSVIEESQGDPNIKMQVMQNLAQNPIIQKKLGSITTQNPAIPPEQQAQNYRDATQAGITETQGKANYWKGIGDAAVAGNRLNTKPTDPLDTATKIAKLLDSNTDVNTGKVIDSDLDATLRQKLKETVGVKSSSGVKDANGQSINLAQLLSGSPQDQVRTGWGIFGDDTVSQGAIRQKANDYVSALVNSGMDEKAARKKVEDEYNDLLVGEKGKWFKTYPDVDIAKLFEDQDTRSAAIQDGKVVTDTGDGVKTAPSSLPTIGITDPNEQEDFSALESMVGKSMPDFNLREDYKRDPKFYQELLKTIREGVPDPANPDKKRKLSVKEIIDLIKG